MDYPTQDNSALLQDGKFTDGDALAGIPASIDRSDYQNMVFDELINIIIAAGREPDFNVRDQVLQSIRDLITNDVSTVFSVLETITTDLVVSAPPAAEQAESTGITIDYSAKTTGVSGSGNMCYGNGAIWARKQFDSSGGTSSTVMKFVKDSFGNYQYDSEFVHANETTSCVGLAIDSDYTIWLLSNLIIYKYVPSGGTYVYSSENFSIDGEVVGPLGMSIDSSDNLWICSYTDSLIHQYTPSAGSYVKSGVTVDISALTAVGWPAQVTFDEADNMWVLDRTNGIVYEFVLSGGVYSLSGNTFSITTNTPGGRWMTYEADGVFWVNDESTDTYDQYQLTPAILSTPSIGILVDINDKLKTPNNDIVTCTHIIDNDTIKVKESVAPGTQDGETGRVMQAGDRIEYFNTTYNVWRTPA